MEKKFEKDPSKKEMIYQMCIGAGMAIAFLLFVGCGNAFLKWISGQ